ncbi:MAG: FlgD immunoglobulin-like domain containing protein [Bacteroidota bacterium]|nr:FlgD immunoglobulin-like domain containing protein [Bacteroidota bacterium]
MKNKLTRYACAPPNGSGLRPRFIRRMQIFVSVTMMLLLNIGSAQDLIVNGTLNNTGKIRVKNQTTITQPNVGGEIELKGADQTLPAKQYQNIRLSGTGTKTTSGGNLSVQKNLTIAPAITLQIPKGDIITLGDTLFDSGTVKGAIQKSVDLTGSTTSSNFGNIGATISWSSKAPGITSVIRASDSLQIGNGNQSVKRYYQIQPTDATATGKVSFKFADAELNGHEINNLQLWRSTDNGATWLRQIPVVDTLLKTISKTDTDVVLKGLWAIADTIRALGPLNFAAGIPSSMANASKPNIQPRILTTLDTFKVLITDIFGTPLKNISVTFAISDTPSTAAVGQKLSNTLTTTDSLGYAATVLTLGNKVGTYTVTATSSSLTPIEISTFAKYGAPDSVLQASNFVQTKPILSALDSLFTITVFDIGGNPVDSAQAHFIIASVPFGASDTSLSVANVQTNSFGRASTILTLGSKVGPYTVRAFVDGLSDTAIFNANAIPGSPTNIVNNGGSNQSGVNGQPLANPFEAFVTDAGGNPVAGDTITFTILNGQTNGAALSQTKVPTNSLGIATTILTLGTKTDVPYIVQAQSVSIGGALTYTATALPGAASATNIISGNNQTLAISKVLTDSFVVHITDANGNPVPNTSVKFTITSAPIGGVGILSVIDTTTDSFGNASTRLTLGNKAGLYVVNAEVTGVPIVTFNATAIPGNAVSFAAVSGNNQSTQIITALANEFIVRVVDAGGNNVAGITVNFAIDSIPANDATGQLIATPSVVSDANGLARTKFTVGNKVGLYRVKASSVGVPDTFFTATATHGAASAMIASAGFNQTKPILTPLDIPFTLHVVDVGGNDVAGTTVNFTFDSIPANANGQLFTDSTVVSDANGIARTTLTIGNKVGLYRVKASGAGVSPITFTATATYGAIAQIAQILGNAQTRPTATMLDTAFVVTVKDAGGNVIPQAKVSFTITSRPANATGQRLTDTLVTADSLGVASTFLTLGDIEGSYVVSATSSGISSSQFISNAFYIYGDPNNDIDVNIADITMMIDHIYSKNVFSMGDSIKSDLNKDGKVDTADVKVLEENILLSPLLLVNRTAPVGPVNGSRNQTDSTTELAKQQYFSDATAQLEVTSQGLRLNMVNNVPIRGIELRIRTKDSTAVDRINYLFARAQKMDVVVRSINNDITILVYSLLNSEIQPGEGTILRLPKITSLAQIDTSQVILSITSNIAVRPEVKTESAPASAYPVTYRLEQNYPNPFNGSTIIRYDIPDIKSAETKIALQVFNILGQKIKTLVNTPHDPGPHQVTWDGTNDNGERVATGVYFYRLITKNFLTTKKMIYVK